MTGENINYSPFLPALKTLIDNSFDISIMECRLRSRCSDPSARAQSVVRIGWKDTGLGYGWPDRGSARQPEQGADGHVLYLTRGCRRHQRYADRVVNEVLIDSQIMVTEKEKGLSLRHMEPIRRLITMIFEPQKGI